LLIGKSGPGSKGSRRARKAANAPSAQASSGEESHSKKAKTSKAAAPKRGRKWDADGLADEDSDTPLDYSAPANGATSGEDEGKERPGNMEQVDQTSWGSKTGKGQFVLKDLDDQVNSILAIADAKKSDANAATTGIVGSSLSAIGGIFRNVVGGKTLTKADLDKAMKGMEDHLLKKNVAREAAIRLCEGVERELIGVKTGNFESMYSTRSLCEVISDFPKAYKQKSRLQWNRRLEKSLLQLRRLIYSEKLMLSRHHQRRLYGRSDRMSSLSLGSTAWANLPISPKYASFSYRTNIKFLLLPATPSGLVPWSSWLFTFVT
jgi:signal recognition particle GTPase